MVGRSPQAERANLAYLRDMLGQMRMLAQSSRQELLAYTISLAMYEADRALKHASAAAEPDDSAQAGREIRKESLYLPED